MVDGGDWVESSVASAVRSAAEEGHSVPEAVAATFRELLTGTLGRPLRPAELRDAVHRLAAANSSAT